ncbi:hypothetical protein BHE74_00050845 [Ensete ventricosum]|nr:hypothetical protein GW17_00016550 [Ensete ventricosum]RWW43486.1 hypothetical protein BHE74_00050845 [Ensete ventricosum]RZS04611.1 hypothetical protein BHM03_00034974 [Ensete ventricosum]
MLSRFVSFRLPLRFLILTLASSHPGLSSDRRNGDGGDWKFTTEFDEVGSLFGENEGSLAGVADGTEDGFEMDAAATGADAKGGDSWDKGSMTEGKGDIFDGIDLEIAAKEGGGGGGEEERETAKGYKPWSLGDGEEKGEFDVGEKGVAGIEGIDDGGVEDPEKARGPMSRSS